MELKAPSDDSDGSLSTERNEKMAAIVTELVPTPILRRPDAVLQVPLGEWMTLRFGEGQCDVTEACLEGMRAGDKCEVRFSWQKYCIIELKRVLIHSVLLQV